MGLLIELSARSLLITFVTSLVVFRPQLHSKGSSRDVPSISVYAWCREGALLLAAFIWKLCFAPSVILVAVLLKPRAKIMLIRIQPALTGTISRTTFQAGNCWLGYG